MMWLKLIILSINYFKNCLFRLLNFFFLKKTFVNLLEKSLNHFLNKHPEVKVMLLKKPEHSNIKTPQENHVGVVLRKTV